MLSYRSLSHKATVIAATANRAGQSTSWGRSAMNATTTSPAPRSDAKAIACIAFWNASESVTRARWLGRPRDNDSTSPARVTGIEYDRKTGHPVPRFRVTGYDLLAILAELYPNIGTWDVRDFFGISARARAHAT